MADTRADRRLVDAGRRFGARRGSRRGLRLLAVLGVVVVAFGAAAWVAFGSSALALRTVTVEGVSRVTVQQVLDRAALPPGRSLLLVDPATVARRVERIPAVAQADVARRWPHTLVIHVVERKPAAAVVGPTGTTLLDRTGVPFASATTAPSGLLRVQVAGPVPGSGSGAARAAMRVVEALPRPIRSRVEQVRATSADDVSLVLSGGATVVWGSAQDNAEKARVLQVLLRRHADRYDVSVPDVAVTG